MLAAADKAQALLLGGGDAFEQRLPVRYDSTVRALTDEAQGLRISVLNLNKNQWFYLSAIFFAFPFLYGTVYQVLVPDTPSAVYFDSCHVNDNLQASIVNSWPPGTVLTFQDCISCNAQSGVPRNLVGIEPQKEGSFPLRLIGAAGTLLGWALFFALYVRFCRYGRRALNLLAYGIYVEPSEKPVRAVVTLSAYTLLLGTLYVLLVIVSGTALETVYLGGGTAASGVPICWFNNSDTGAVEGKYRVVADFFNNNTSTSSFTTTTIPTWRDWGSAVLSAAVLFVPVVVTILKQYTAPYSCIALDQLISAGSADSSNPSSRGIANIVSSTIRYRIREEELEAKLPLYMKERGIVCKLTLLQRLVRLASEADRPAEEFFCETWGDSESAVQDALNWLNGLGVVRLVGENTKESLPLPPAR